MWFGFIKVVVSAMLEWITAIAFTNTHFKRSDSLEVLLGRFVTIRTVGGSRLAARFHAVVTRC